MTIVSVSSAGDRVEAGAIMRPVLEESLPAPRVNFHFECVGPDGEVKWVEDFLNIVTTAGRTDLVDKYLKGSAYTAAWYLILAGAGTKAAADTLASHAGWAEVTPYTGNRPAITWGTTSGGANTSSPVSIPITGTATVAGAGITTAATGTSGVLYNAGDFASARSVASGDTLNITMSISIT